MALQAFQQRKYFYDFDPRSIGGCAAWFDGSDSNSIIRDASGLVQAWLDKTGNNRHLTQATPNNRPGYRLSGIDMSTGFQRLDTSGWLASNYECYGVGYIDQSSAFTLHTLAMMKNNQRLIAASTGTSDGASVINTPVHSNTTTWASCPAFRSPFLFSANVNTSLVANLRINGSQSLTAPTFVTTADISTIGNDVSLSYPFGVINEFIMYYGQHTIEQRRFIEEYLSHKWRSTNTFQQPSQGFAPTDISGCSLWLDGNDDTKFDLSGPVSNSIWVWKDKSGNGWDVSQALSAGRPTYVTNDRYKYVNFTAANTQRIFFNTTFLSNRVFNRSFSFFAVVTNDSTQANNCFFGATVNSSRNQLIVGWRSGQLGFGFNGDDANLTIGDQMTSNSFVYPKIVYFEHDSATFDKRMYSNAMFCLRKVGNSNLLGATSQCIGFAHLGLTQPYFNGRVCEVLFYDRVLPTSNIQTLHGYLMNKWQVPPQNPYTFPNHESFFIRNPVVRDFVPNDIRNCILWLDAGDPTSYTLSNNVLTAWRDKSFFRSDADICGSPVYTLHPSNQKYGFYFDKASFARGNASFNSNIFTSFLVTSIDTSAVTRGRFFGVTGRQDVSDITDVSGIALVVKGATSNQVAMLKGSTAERCPMDCSWETPKVIFSGYDAYEYAGGQNRMITNGVMGPISGGRLLNVWGTTKYTLMGTAGCNFQDNGNGYVFEALLYNSYLNYEEIDQVQNYLARKWNITDVSGFSFRSRVPTTSIGIFPNLTALDITDTNQNRNCILWLDALDSNTYTVSNNAITRLESKGVYGGSLTTTLGATYLPGYDATGLNGKPCFTTSIAAPGARLYGTYGYAATNWGTVLNYHTVIMVVQPTSNIDASFGRIFSSYGGAGNDSTAGSGFAITTSNTTSPYTVSTLRFSIPTPATNVRFVTYRTPTTLTAGTPTILSYNGLNDGGNHTPTTWAIGSVANAPTVSTNTWELKVGEVLVFQNGMTPTNMQRIEGYLARKWGIDICTNHPYKYVRP